MSIKARKLKKADLEVDFFCIASGRWGALVAGRGMGVNIFLLTTNETVAFVPQSRDYGGSPMDTTDSLRRTAPEQHNARAPLLTRLRRVTLF